MSAPSTSWNLVRIHGTWLTQNGALMPGKYTVTIPVRIANHTDDSIIPAGVFASGALQTDVATSPSLDVLVPATDDPDNDPQPAWQVRIDVTFTGGASKESYSLDVPLAGGDIDLSTVALPQSIPASNPAYKVGVAGGLATYNSAGLVQNADGSLPSGGGGTALTSYASQVETLSDYPATFPPAPHTHTVADVTSLQADLDAKVPTTRAVNGKPLSADVTLAASDVAAVPTTRMINGKSLSADVTLAASDVSAVPTTRTVNGKALSANVTLASSDVGAAPTTRQIAGLDLSADRTAAALWAALGIMPLAEVPAGTTITVLSTPTGWPPRPTTRPDVFIIGLDINGLGTQPADSLDGDRVITPS